MNLKPENLDFKFARRAILCIAVGTASGLFVYEIFLYFNIAIFGWNLGLIFAPLSAGYVETILANKILGKNLGAKSAFILFIDTTIYSFILKNPTLGFNFITVGSIFVILQAAFPTVVNHIVFVVLGGLLSAIARRYKQISRKIKYYIDRRPLGYWDGSPVEIKANTVTHFNEGESNKRLNSLDFFFLTSSDMADRKHEIMGIYQSEIILEKKKHLGEDPEIIENAILMRIKEGKDDCLVKLANQIKENGGNGILDLSMNYALIGLGGDNVQITAMGMAVKITDL